MLAEPHAPEFELACNVGALVKGMAPVDLEPVLLRLRQAGYRHAVLPPVDPDATDADALRRVFTETGIHPIAMVGQRRGADVSSEDEAECRAGAEALQAGVEFAAAIGARHLTGVPYGVFGHPAGPTPPRAFERAARHVGAAADIAADLGIVMTFEVLNRYETSVVNTAEQAVDFVGLSRSENLCIHLDTFHMAIEESDMTAAIRTALPWLEYLELGQSGRGFLSTGVIDLPRFIGRVIDAGYAGLWGIEAFSRPVVGTVSGDELAIWRSPYDSGQRLLEDAMAVVHEGRSARVADACQGRSDRGDDCATEHEREIP